MSWPAAAELLGVSFYVTLPLAGVGFLRGAGGRLPWMPVLVFARLGYQVQREICEEILSQELERLRTLGYRRRKI